MKISLRSACVGCAVLFSIGGSYASDEKIGVSADFASASPSGSEVVFSADFDGATRLWAAGIDGSNLRKISKTYNVLTSIYETEPAWSPDGRQIAYSSVNAGVSDIWVMQADGSYPVKLTGNGANNTRPTWSPDGRKIAYVSDKGGTKDIWIMNADGAGQTKIVALSGEENRPSFSPAGAKIVFSETVNGNATLMVANIDGSNVNSLTTGKFQDWDPYWGPNGIVFSSNRDTSSEHWKLWMIQPDGTGLRSIANTIGLSPTVLRDGRLLFTDEMMASRPISSIGIVNPVTGAKQIAINVQGYFTPIDIRPGKAVNNLNPNSRGKLEVAILSTKTFDATKAVNQSTITFGRTGSEQSLSKCSKKTKDVNNDGFPDLRCRFWIRNTGIQNNDKIGVLRFIGNDGTPYEGRDAIVIVNTDDEDDFKDQD